MLLLLQMAPVLAQANGFQPRNEPEVDAGFAAGFVICYVVFLLALFVLFILFMVALSRCLAACSPRNRTMEPGQVWLNLIPLFNYVWIFITVIRVSESLKREFHVRRMTSDDPEFGKTTGLIYTILTVVSCFPINLIFMIMYWLKVVGYKNELLRSRSRGGDAALDDEDDRPRRRRRPADDDDYDDEEDR